MEKIGLEEIMYQHWFEAQLPNFYQNQQEQI